ncbi:MAG: biotin transporter BioY [Clostridia bacterium]|nr:biotin transporter BioY [Clostridia bacterium]
MNIKDKRNLTADISLISVFTAVMCVCSWISIPFMGIPFSLQTLAVFVTASVLGSKKAVISVLIYICLGVIGVPVFTGFKSGASVLLSPTGGYLIGFIFAAGIIGLMIKLLPEKKWIKWLSMLTGQVICYIAGIVWYEFVYLDTAVYIKEALLICVVPFIIPDIIKTAAAVILSDSVNRIFKKQNIDTLRK